MPKTITIDIFDSRSIENAIKALEIEQQRLERKSMELAKRLADIGVIVARVGFATTLYDGDDHVEVTVEPIKNGYAIVAKGEAVAFIEFGAGATYGYGHPKPDVDGYHFGPGTWNPESPHWNDPKGWYYEHGKRSLGNAPAMAMYGAEEAILMADIREIAQQVFND